MLTVEQWHRRFLIQARWTAGIRRYFYQQYNLLDFGRILEVGCGTAVITKDIAAQTHGKIYGLDILWNNLAFARNYDRVTDFCCGDALSLPFAKGIFNLTYFHFLLLWLGSPLDALQEMRRVTRRGGIVAALAEPDYGGRIDHPSALVELGRLQTEALLNQKASPYIGRQLRELFHNAGLINVEVGVIGGQWNEKQSDDEYTSEWNMIKADLGNCLFNTQFEAFKKAEKDARKHHTRILYIPTFYAWGSVP